MGKKHKSNKRRLEKRRRRESKRKVRRGARRRQRPFQFSAGISDLPWSGWDPASEGLAGLARRNECSPFAAAMLAQDLEEDEEVELPDGFWTPRRVEALATGDILARLGGPGLTIDEAGFVRAAEPRRSAWELAETLWADRLRAEGADEVFAFAGLAACELWKRWIPGRASKEGLTELIAEGYAAAPDGLVPGPDADEAHSRALEIWLGFWDALVHTLPAETKTVIDLQASIEITHDLGQWVEDLFSAALTVASRWPERAQRVLDVLRTILDRCPEEREDFVVPILLDIVTLLDRVGRRDEAEAAAHDVVARFPRRSAGYIALADLAEGTWPPTPARAAAACAILEDARGRVDDGDDFDLDLRVIELRAIAEGDSTKHRADAPGSDAPASNS